jgi:hypothetical protein
MTRFWLDASFFIHASRNLYAFDINESFWAWLDDRILEGVVVSPKRVYEEVTANLKHQDALARWVKSRKRNGLCIPPDAAVQRVAKDVSDYIFSGRYPIEEAWDFSRGADAWVISHAKADGGHVVTCESQQHPEANKVRIPDVCHNFKVECYDIIGAMRVMKARI